MCSTLYDSRVAFRVVCGCRLRYWGGSDGPDLYVKVGWDASRRLDAVAADIAHAVARVSESCAASGYDGQEPEQRDM
jgi:hypothetical protein